MAKKHPTFNVGDVVITNVRGREDTDLRTGLYLVVEVLRGPGMRVRNTRSRAARKVMRKHFTLFASIEERVAEMLMADGE